MKISTGVKSCQAYLEGRICSQKGMSKHTEVEDVCSICGAIYKYRTDKIKKFCSKECSYKNPAVGGHRPGSGRSKSGWYKGFYCGSTWELAYLIWSLDHDINIQRCTKKFEYEFEGQKRSYLPDFVVDDTYIEIKGYDTPQTQAKISQFTEKINILFEDDLKSVFDYVKGKYGAKYYELYEGNPHNQKLNSCKECGSPCKNVYCSRRCTILGNNYYKVRNR